MKKIIALLSFGVLFSMVFLYSCKDKNENVVPNKGKNEIVRMSVQNDLPDNIGHINENGDLILDVEVELVKEVFENEYISIDSTMLANNDNGDIDENEFNQYRTLIDSVFLYKSVESDNQKYYLCGTGVHGLASRNIRVLLEPQIQGEIIFLFKPAGGSTAATETCSGVNCSKCYFKQGGGCDCDEEASIFGGAAYCNHSISK